MWFLFSVCVCVCVWGVKWGCGFGVFLFVCSGSLFFTQNSTHSVFSVCVCVFPLLILRVQKSAVPTITVCVGKG